MPLGIQLGPHGLECHLDDFAQIDGGLGQRELSADISRHIEQIIDNLDQLVDLA